MPRHHSGHAAEPDHLVLRLMPDWLQWVLWAAAGVTALGVIWSKVIKPVYRIISQVEDMLPVWTAATQQLADVPAAFQILRDIIAQLRSDSGTTIKDALNRMEAAITDAAKLANEAKVEIAADRRVDHISRNEMQKQVLVLDRLGQKVDNFMTSLARMEAATGVVAFNLATAQSAVDGVASDLAESHAHAKDVANDSPPGAAADAAATHGPGE